MWLPCGAMGTYNMQLREAEEGKEVEVYTQLGGLYVTQHGTDAHRGPVP